MVSRNQLTEYGEDMVAYLGDPHLGKRFRTGVPTHRLGEREQMVWDDFNHSLLDPREITIHVCMGDLFDKAIVDFQTIFRAFQSYKSAAEQFPKREYFIIMGNHDMSRNAERVSAFQILAEMLDYLKNVHFVTKPEHHHGFGFIPYHPFRTSAEMIAQYREQFGTLVTDAVFGHWDIDTFNSEMPHNIFPAEDIMTLPGCATAFTGHVHQPGVRQYGELELVVTGSMQPYTFAEDTKNELYLTIPYANLYNIDTKTLQNKCVRILLGEGDVLPEIDCLQLIGKREGEADLEDDIDVEMAVFDMAALMRDELSKAGVTDEKVRTFILTEYDRLRAEEA